mgnify:CR=1 FL=1
MVGRLSILKEERDIGLQSRLIALVSQAATDGRRVIDPPDWLGFTLAGMGGLTMLYSVALPRS